MIQLEGDMDKICPRTGEPCTGEDLSSTPLPRGELGDELRERACTACWSLWKEFQVKVINEYRIKTYDPEQRKILHKHMREFFNLDGEQDGPKEEELPGEKSGGGL